MDLIDELKFLGNSQKKWGVGGGGGSGGSGWCGGSGWM